MSSPTPEKRRIHYQRADLMKSAEIYKPRTRVDVPSTGLSTGPAATETKEIRRGNQTIRRSPENSSSDDSPTCFSSDSSLRSVESLTEDVVFPDDGLATNEKPISSSSLSLSSSDLELPTVVTKVPAFRRFDSITLDLPLRKCRSDIARPSSEMGGFSPRPCDGCRKTAVLSKYRTDTITRFLCQECIRPLAEQLVRRTNEDSKVTMPQATSTSTTTNDRGRR
jgi:hypothetical protein